MRALGSVELTTSSSAMNFKFNLTRSNNMGTENQAVIVFFSKDGKNRCGANHLNERLDGKLIELRKRKRETFYRRLPRRSNSETEGLSGPMHLLA